MKNKLISLGKELKKEVNEDRATGLAAEQAYYYLLSLFPLMILLLSILPYLQIEPSEALKFMNQLLPSETTSVLEENIVKILSNQNGGLLTVGILGTIWSASNGMNAFIHAQNIAFDVEESRGFIKARAMSVLLTFLLILAFIVVLVLPVFGSVIMNMINQIIPVPSGIQTLVDVLRWVVAVAVLSIVLALLYRYAPNKTYPFKHVLPGAITATVSWLIISLGFSFYVSNFGNYSSTYGGLGGVIILMIWLYMTGLILVIGGEINAMYHRHHSVPEQAKPKIPKSSANSTFNR
ncbi:YihY/virulence factor BrkB family protein [Bacillus massiliglaciei]|uniref:YihY/virulence factor BrkB family protein n=1 Tax=Bacillus massiliglaciei TaxID=1816693 RepID=UPI000AEA3CBD|nr:YihY/virulence factor BrkB family protein [Bacillus massiliglaciei]